MDILGWLIVIGVCGFLIWVIYTSVVYIYLPRKADKQLLVVVVQNAEESIEGIVREIILWQRQVGQGTRLLIVDINSQDKTIEIIERLAYPNYITLISLDDESQLEQVLARYGSEDKVVIRQYS